MKFFHNLNLYKKVYILNLENPTVFVKLSSGYIIDLKIVT